MQHLSETLRRPLRFPPVHLLTPQLLLRKCLGIWIQPQQNLLVLQRVLLLHARPLRHRLALRRTQHGLHFGRVDQAADVGVVDYVRGEEEVLFQGGWGRGGAVDFIQGGKCG